MSDHRRAWVLGLLLACGVPALAQERCDDIRKVYQNVLGLLNEVGTVHAAAAVAKEGMLQQAAAVEVAIQALEKAPETDQAALNAAYLNEINAANAFRDAIKPHRDKILLAVYNLVYQAPLSKDANYALTSRYDEITALETAIQAEIDKLDAALKSNGNNAKRFFAPGTRTINEKRKELVQKLIDYADYALSLGNEELLEYSGTPKAVVCNNYVDDYFQKNNEEYREHLAGIRGATGKTTAGKIVRGDDESQTKYEEHADSFLNKDPAKLKKAKADVEGDGSRIVIKRGATLWGIARQMAGLENKPKNYKKIQEIVKKLQGRFKRQNKDGTFTDVVDPTKGQVGDIIDLT